MLEAVWVVGVVGVGGPGTHWQPLNTLHKGLGMLGAVWVGPAGGGGVGGEGAWGSGHALAAANFSRNTYKAV